MLRYFPSPYPDEIMYSWFSRYDKKSCNESYEVTSMKLFGKKSAYLNIYYPIRLDYFIEQLPDSWNMTYMDIINEHTIFPLFKPFMSKKRADDVINNMRDGDTRRLSGQIGLNTGNIFIRKERIVKICPECFNEDIAILGEAYIHRTHQIPGNFFCPKHEIMLFEHTIPSTLSKYYFFDVNTIDKDSLKIQTVQDSLKSCYALLSKDIEEVLKGALNAYTIESVREKYNKRLQEKGYFLTKNIKMTRLIEDFVQYYPKEFLQKMESDVEENQYPRWMERILSDSDMFVHPIRHMLLIRFLFGGVTQFVNYNGEYEPFGSAPYPCLNPISDHYKQLTIDKCEIKRIHSISAPIGVFKCFCGFTYVRQGPDNDEKDKFRYGQIQGYGAVWEEKLKKLVLEGNLSIARIAREMKCCRNTIIKYATILGIADKLDTKLRIETKKRNNRLSDEEFEEYKKELLQYVSRNKDASRLQIKKALTKQYQLVSLRDKEWLESILPKPFSRGSGFAVDYKDINWEEKDADTVELVKNAIRNILLQKKAHRITKTYIAKTLNYFGLIQKNVIENLPRTKNLLSSCCETVEDFKKRKETGLYAFMHLINNI